MTVCWVYVRMSFPFGFVYTRPCFHLDSLSGIPLREAQLEDLLPSHFIQCAVRGSQAVR